MPIGDGGTGETGLEGYRAVEHSVDHKKTSIPPPANAEASHVDVRQGAEIAEPITLVRQLLCRKPQMNGFLEIMSATRGSLIVECEYDISLLGHQLHPESSRASPGVP